VAALVEISRQLAKAGLPPSQVAEIVFDAIRQEKFYILTNPKSTKQTVQLRLEDILQERMPTDIFQPAKPPSQ
jgi:hypothetical protein